MTIVDSDDCKLDNGRLDRWKLPFDDFKLENLKLDRWTEKFPLRAINFYKSKGISELFRWQAECLSLDGILDGSSNLVFSAPTSGGKSMVAELILVRKILETRKKSIVVFPFISIAREKFLFFREIFGSCGINVEGYFGSLQPVGGLDTWDAAVFTIEKANGFINRLIEQNDLEKIGCIVVDELHTIGDSSRGYLLELLLTKVLYYAKIHSCQIQIIGMSATLPNINVLARWLDAKLYETDFRPVPVTHYIKVGSTLHDQRMQIVRHVEKRFIIAEDSDNVLGLCLEVILDGGSVLIFCSTKNWCEQLASTLANLMSNILSDPAKTSDLADQLRPAPSDPTKTPLDPTKSSGLADQLRSALQLEKLAQFLNDFKQYCHGAVDPVLLSTIPFGIAYHHAGLVMEERDYIESAFRRQLLRIIVATSTLSSGVNLPARRVIIRSPYGTPGKPGPVLTPSLYKQIIGRSGRKGMDVSGDSILICKPNEVRRAREITGSDMEPMKSCLCSAADSNSNSGQPALSRSLKRILLEAFVNGLVKTVADAKAYLQSTLMAAQMDSDLVANSNGATNFDAVDNCTKWLVEKHFLVKTADEICRPTQLGNAALAASLSPDEALAVYEDLGEARKGLVLFNDLHLVFLVTPIYLQWPGSISWYDFYQQSWCRMTPEFRSVGDRIGLREADLLKLAHGQTLSRKADEHNRKLAIYTRFYTAMGLHELILEHPFEKVAEKYGCPRGFLQQLQQQAATYASMIVTFCDRLGWDHMRCLLNGMAERICFGVRRELSELVQIEGIDGGRARAFYANVAAASPAEVSKVLRKCVAFECDSKKQLWLVGHPELNDAEAASLIIERAKKLWTERLRTLGVHNVEISTLTQFGPKANSENPQEPPKNPPAVVEDQKTPGSQTDFAAKLKSIENFQQKEAVDDLVKSIGRVSLSPTGRHSTSTPRPRMRKRSNPIANPPAGEQRRLSPLNFNTLTEAQGEMENAEDRSGGGGDDGVDGGGVGGGGDIGSAPYKSSSSYLRSKSMTQESDEIIADSPLMTSGIGVDQDEAAVDCVDHDEAAVDCVDSGAKPTKKQEISLTGSQLAAIFHDDQSSSPKLPIPPVNTSSDDLFADADEPTAATTTTTVTLSKSQSDQQTLTIFESPDDRNSIGSTFGDVIPPSQPSVVSRSMQKRVHVSNENSPSPQVRKKSRPRPQATHCKCARHIDVANCRFVNIGSVEQSDFDRIRDDLEKAKMIAVANFDENSAPKSKEKQSGSKFSGAQNSENRGEPSAVANFVLLAGFNSTFIVPLGEICSQCKFRFPIGSKARADLLKILLKSRDRLIAFDAKSLWRRLIENGFQGTGASGINCCSQMYWLLKCGGGEGPTLKQLLADFSPRSLGLLDKQPTSLEASACVESIVAFITFPILLSKFRQSADLGKSLKMEQKILRPLTLMETHGILFSFAEAIRLKQDLQEKLRALESLAHRLL